MAPRLRCPTARGITFAFRGARTATRQPLLLLSSAPGASSTRHYAKSASAVSRLTLPDDFIPPTRPPTARPPDVRKAQLLRSYTSMLRSTPLMLIFQHNNMTAVEWAAIRRELRIALGSVPAQASDPADISSGINIQVIRTRMFDAALKIVEYFDPSKVEPTLATSLYGEKVPTVYNHDLSKAAYETVKAATKNLKDHPDGSVYSQLAPLLVGPLAVLTFPAVSPAHLAAALSILAPSPPAFPAPTRRKAPGYYDATAQGGLQKLLLIGGRIEDRAFDVEGVKWVGGIEGGLDGLRAQLVYLLQSAGLGLTSTLEGAGKSLWLTMESRRSVLEEAEKGPEEKEQQAS